MLFSVSNRSDPKILVSATLHYEKKKKLVAYLRSPGLSLGSIPSFFCLYLHKFFMQLLISLVTVFSLDMPEMQVSHICILS